MDHVREHLKEASRRRRESWRPPHEAAMKTLGKGIDRSLMIGATFTVIVLVLVLALMFSSAFDPMSIVIAIAASCGVVYIALGRALFLMRRRRVLEWKDD